MKSALSIRSQYLAIWASCFALISPHVYAKAPLERIPDNLPITYAEPAPIQIDSRCQAESFCVFTEMPLYYQQSSQLEELSKTVVGSFHPGLCVPTALSMSLSGLLTEADPTSVRASWLKYFEDIEDPNMKIILAGLKVRTDFSNGGTFMADLKSLYRELRNESKGLQNVVVEDGTGNFDHTSPSTQFFINKIRSQKFAFVLELYAYQSKKNFWGEVWKVDGAHAVAVNGFDRGTLKIYDPWNKIYYVQIRNERFKVHGLGPKKDRSVVKVMAGYENDWGFATHSQYENKKVVVPSYIGWSFR